MNRVVIIGNGFDLSHGMKTSYKDFLIDYIKTVLIEVKEKNKYEDELMIIDTEFQDRIINHSIEITDENALRIYGNIKSDEFLRSYVYSDLLSSSLTRIDTIGWVDIETLYFDLLFKKYEFFLKKKEFNDLEKFFNEFESIKSKLSTYLIKQEFNSNSIYHPAFKYYIEKISDSVIRNGGMSSGVNTTPNSICFLNFNYTNTVSYYFDAISKLGCKVELNHIHGDLNEQFGSPIFGFGDVQDERFLAILKQNDNKLLANMKAFDYLDNTNYSKLRKHLLEDVFEVFILGHSCGLSDKTLLNKIFEHKNCIKIQLFYYELEPGIDDFKEKAINIARIFHDQTEWLEKIVGKKASFPMYQ